MEKEISTNKIINKLIALVTSVILLALLMALDIIEIHVINQKYIIVASILSLLFSLGSIIFKYKNLTKKQRYNYYQVLDFFLMLNSALIFIQLFFLLAFFPATVYKSSMYPNLKEGENLIVQSLGKPDRFEIVVLKIDSKINNLYGGVYDDELIVKRVIAVGGDSFYYDNAGILHLNGYEVEEKYLKDENGNFKTDGAIYNAKTNPFKLEDFSTISGENVCTPDQECKVPKDYIFVLGDNRSSSIDSRALGLFHISQVMGIAKYKQKSLFDWDKL